MELHPDTGAIHAGPYLVVKYIRDAVHALRIVHLPDGKAEWIELPGIGTVGPMHINLEAGKLYFVFSSLGTPSPPP